MLSNIYIHVPFYSLYVSGVTGGGGGAAGGHSETSDREISVDLSGKDRQGKKREMGEKEGKFNCKSKGEKFKMEEGKVTKYEERLFCLFVLFCFVFCLFVYSLFVPFCFVLFFFCLFFLFCFCFSLFKVTEILKFVWVYQNGNFLPGKSISRRGKIRKNDCPLRKIFLLRPCYRPTLVYFIHQVTIFGNILFQDFNLRSMNISEMLKKHASKLNSETWIFNLKIYNSLLTGVNKLKDTTNVQKWGKVNFMRVIEGAQFFEITIIIFSIRYIFYEETFKLTGGFHSRWIILVFIFRNDNKISISSDSATKRGRGTITSLQGCSLHTEFSHRSPGSHEHIWSSIWWSIFNHVPQGRLVSSVECD